ncbi:hypothetical protein CR513_15229, partial [Mucuna pruriens]
MKHKSEVCQIFVDFFCLVKNQFGKSIKRLWSDNGIEFVNLEFSKFLKDNGVVHELTCVNTPTKWARKNRHFLECVAFFHSHNPHCVKLDPRAVKCVFIGSQWMLLFMKYNHSLLALHFRGRVIQKCHQDVIESLSIPIQVVTKLTLVPEQVQLSELECKFGETLERYKVRLVAKRYTQTYKIDYEETFAPVAKMNMVRVILSLAALFGWNLQQFVVKNAFFHGDLEEVYMEISLGFYSHNEKNKSLRVWFERFAQVIISLGYRQSQGNHTLFIKHSPNGKLTLLVYIDNMIVTGDDEIEKLTLKEKLATKFEMKELGKLKYFLEIEVAYSKQGIFISQMKNVLDLLKETGKLGCKTSRVPIEQNHRIECEESPTIEKFQYQRLVGILIYLSHSRSDIAYAISVVSQFMHDPKERHRSKKQNVVARSSAEAEFRAMPHGICEGFITHNPFQHDKTKYIEIDKHFLNEKLNSGLVVTTDIPTRFQVANVVTKGLPAARFQELNSKLGMSDKSSFPFSTERGEAPEFSSDHSESNVVTALQHNVNPNSFVGPGLVTSNQHSKDKLKNAPSSYRNTNGFTEDSSLSNDESSTAVSTSSCTKRVVVYSRKTNVKIEDGGTILPFSDDKW